MRLATSEKWVDKKSNERKERTEWHRLVAFGNLAEIANKYLKKGARVYVEGRIQTRKWSSQDGADHYTTEIIMTDMKMLDRKGGESAGASAIQAPDPAGRADNAYTPPPEGAWWTMTTSPSRIDSNEEAHPWRWASSME